MIHKNNPDHYQKIPPILARKMSSLRGRRASCIKALKRLIRKHLLPVPVDRWNEGYHPIDVYDCRVWQAIREVIQEN